LIRSNFFNEDQIIPKREQIVQGTKNPFPYLDG